MIRPEISRIAGLVRARAEIEKDVIFPALVGRRPDSQSKRRMLPTGGGKTEVDRADANERRRGRRPLLQNADHWTRCVGVVGDKQQIARLPHRRDLSWQAAGGSQVRRLIRDPVVICIGQQEQVARVATGRKKRLRVVVPTRMPPPYCCMLVG